MSTISLIHEDCVARATVDKVRHSGSNRRCEVDIYQSVSGFLPGSPIGYFQNSVVKGQPLLWLVDPESRTPPGINRDSARDSHIEYRLWPINCFTGIKRHTAPAIRFCTLNQEPRDSGY